MARSTLTSRRPPWLSLRSGSSRNATSPAVSAALGHLRFEQREVPGAQAVAPGGTGFFEERLGHSGLAPHHPAVEQAQGHPHVLGGGAQHLRGAANRVVEVHTLVPDRVPDGVGDGLDLPVAVVDQHHVEVAVGAQGARPYPPTATRARCRLVSPAARSARPESQASASAA